MATLVVAIIQGADWGWASPRILGLFALTALLIAIVARRIAYHPSPIVEPALLKVRTFSLATAASLLFFMAFAAMLLASVLFLTGIWHEPILTAGLEIFPGPAMAAATAVPGATARQPLRPRPRRRRRRAAVRARRRVVGHAPDQRATVTRPTSCRA